MLESLMVILTLVGLFLVVLGFTSIETGKGSVGGILFLLGGILLWGVFALSRDYYPPEDLEIPKTCRQVPIQTSQAGINFIEVDSEFINLNYKFGRSFENCQIIWIQETLPVKFTSFYGYERTTEGSFEILLQKPATEIRNNEGE